jgi:hypothetical protein
MFADMIEAQGPLAADTMDGVVGSLRECLTVLRRIDRDNLTVGAGEIHRLPDGGIESPLYGQMKAAIEKAQAALFIHAAKTEGVFYHV